MTKLLEGAMADAGGGGGRNGCQEGICCRSIGLAPQPFFIHLSRFFVFYLNNFFTMFLPQVFGSTVGDTMTQSSMPANSFDQEAWSSISEATRGLEDDPT
jgi:hypothetical protein